MGGTHGTRARTGAEMMESATRSKEGERMLGKGEKEKAGEEVLIAGTSAASKTHVNHVAADSRARW